jgi:nicotinamidase-related amidase
MTKNILVVIDVQNDFIYGKFSTKQARNIVKDIYEEIRNNTVHYDEIIFTKDTHNSHEFFPTARATYEGNRFEEHCIYESGGWEIVFPICDVAGEKIYKNTFDGSDRIIDYLKEEYHLNCEAEEHTKFNFYLCGVCTDICVLATAIGLTKHDCVHSITVLTDICAGTSPKSHNTAVAAMAPFGIVTTTLQDIKKKYKEYSKHNKESKNDSFQM